MPRRRQRLQNLPAGGGAHQHMLLDYAMTQSVAFRTLPSAAVKVFIELRGRYNGRNNGRLRLSLREAKRLLRLGESTVARAFLELEERGFIKLRKRGQWYGRLAAEWEITALPMDGNLATRDWNHWKPAVARPGSDSKTEIAPIAASSAPPIAPVAASLAR